MNEIVDMMKVDNVYFDIQFLEDEENMEPFRDLQWIRQECPHPLSFSACKNNMNQQLTLEVRMSTYCTF